MNQQLDQLRACMAERGIDVYLVPACDYHQSEYFSDYFFSTRFLSGFTGESCTIVVTKDEAHLWTDGRYFIQAEEQMDAAFTLERMQMPGVPTVAEFLESAVPEGGCLGFDGRLISVQQFHEYSSRLDRKKVRYAWQEDLVDLIWKDRPALDCRPAFVLDEKYAGRSASDKLAAVRAEMKKVSADAYIMASLDDIAWLFNIRGDDVPNNPVVISYAMVTGSDAVLYVHDGVADDAVTAALQKAGARVAPYDQVFEDAAALPEHSRVLINESRVSMALVSRLPKSCVTVPGSDPTTMMKAIKNDVEIQNTLNAHVKDGIAMVRFMIWLKTDIGRIPMTEITASDYLEQLRRSQPLNRGLSFDTISGYGPHGAMMHYTAKPETASELKPEGFLLVDSGGQYLDGTTDITRTFVLGPITDEMKMHFTAVVRGMLSLGEAKFLYGCTGQSLDYLARHPMWDLGIDYRCGTGHGVGFLLNVHEGPQDFRWKTRPGRPAPVAIEPGMITTDEPGIYLDYRYGIRIENELLCEKAEENEYGQFLKFRHITYCPIDLDGIDRKYMSPHEVDLLNQYHQMVYHTLAEHLTPEERNWLKQATRAI